MVGSNFSCHEKRKKKVAGVKRSSIHSYTSVLEHRRGMQDKWTLIEYLRDGGWKSAVGVSLSCERKDRCKTENSLLNTIRNRKCLTERKNKNMHNAGGGSEMRWSLLLSIAVRCCPLAARYKAEGGITERSSPKPINFTVLSACWS